MSQNSTIQNLLSKRRAYWAIGICLIITGLLFYFEYSHSDFSLSTLNFTGLSVLYLFLAVLMMVFRDLAYMVRIRLLTDKVLSWRQSFHVIMIWEFASALSPGVVGGSAVAMFILQKEKIALGKATSLVIVSLIMDNLFYLLFLPMTLLFFNMDLLLPADLADLKTGGLSLLWIGYAIILIITILLLISVLFTPGLIRALIRLIFQFPGLRKRKEKAEQIGRDVMISAKALRGKPPSFWFKVFIATCWSWISRFMVINFILLAFINSELLDQAIILGRQLMMWLIMLITPTPGGSGMAEFLFTQLFGAIIANGALVVSLAFLWRLISYYPYLLIGSVLLPRWLRKK